MLLFQKYFGYVDRSSLSMRCDKTMWKCAPSGKVVCLRLHRKPFIIIQVKKLKLLPFNVSDHARSWIMVEWRNYGVLLAAPILFCYAYPLVYFNILCICYHKLWWSHVTRLESK
jgi:hypothetical protein